MSEQLLDEGVTGGADVLGLAQAPLGVAQLVGEVLGREMLVIYIIPVDGARLRYPPHLRLPCQSCSYYRNVGCEENRCSRRDC